MRTSRKKAITLFSAVCLLGALTAGCASGSAPSAKTAADQPDKVSLEEVNNTQPAEDADTADTETPAENAGGRWHVLAPEVAAKVDADFEGTIWHIAEGAFSIAETQVQILDDGSLVSSSPSSSADIPDSDLIHVVVDDDTYFYIRTIQGSGESYEDTEAGFGDLKEHMSVQMKGSFENDVFYAAEIRMIKIS